MQTQVRPPRQRNSGGRTLMLLGLVLALAAAAIVFYITSSVQGTIGQTVSVVTAQVSLKAGTILTVNDSTGSDVRIQDVFAVKQYDKKAVPPDAYLYTNQDALNTVLDKKVVKEDFLQGDILRNPDPRLADIGTASGLSLTNVNPPALKPGQVLFVMNIDNAEYGVQPGDYINIIATGQVATTTGGTDTISQTTLSDLYVYAVDVPVKGKIVLVVSNQDAVYLADLERGGFLLTLVIRKPGDTGNPSGTNPDGGTQSVDGTSIFKHFGYGNVAKG